MTFTAVTERRTRLPTTSVSKRVLLYSVTFGLTLAVILGLAEIGLRLSGRVTTESIHGASDREFDHIPGAFEPGQDATEQPHPKLAHHVTIDSLGYRGPEIRIEKAPGTVRVLCLGDSFTYGYLVNNEETFPYYLQGEFSRRGLPIEVINGGVGGTTIIDQTYLLKKSMMMQPDIVILTFTENDIDDLNMSEPLYISLAKNRKLKSGYLSGTVYRLVRNTALFNFLLRVKAWYTDVTTPRNVISEVTASSESEGDELWHRYENELREMAMYLRIHSIDLIFAIFPSHYRIEKASSPTNRLTRIRDIAARNGINTLDLLDPLQKTNLTSRDLYLLPYDGHPSKTAYSTVAKAMANQVVGLCARRC